MLSPVRLFVPSRNAPCSVRTSRVPSPPGVNPSRSAPSCKQIRPLPGESGREQRRDRCSCQVDAGPGGTERVESGEVNEVPVDEHAVPHRRPGQQDWPVHQAQPGDPARRRSSGGGRGTEEQPAAVRAGDGQGLRHEFAGDRTQFGAEGHVRPPGHAHAERDHAVRPGIGPSASTSVAI